MSHVFELGASETSPRFDAEVLRRTPHWSLEESAFMCGVSKRTVHRLLADPDSGFPKAKRVRGRVLLSGAEVIKFMERS